MPDAVLCPESIYQWELAHGFMRTEINGMMYSHCPNFQATCAQMDRERQKRDNDYRLWLFSKTPQGFTEWMSEREAGRK